MKYLAGFSAALFTGIVLRIIQAIFTISIPEFLIGWFTCTGWYTAMRIYEISKINQKLKL